jgi:UDP-glucose 4-epimerase
VRLLVTGAFGYLGGRLATAWARDGFDVVVSGRRVPASAAWAQAFEMRLGDLTSQRDVAALTDGVDAVVHLAALDEHEATADPARALAISGEATGALLDASMASGVSRFVFFSTYHVYSPRPGEAITERTATSPTHPYAVAHVAGERQTLEHRGIDAVVLRVTNGYGAPMAADVDRWTLAHNDFCRQVVHDGRIVLKTPGLQHRDFVWVEDVARATALVLRASASDLHPVYNLGSNTSRSIASVAELVRARAQERLGRPIGLERPPTTDRSETPVSYSIERLERLGFTPSDGMIEETDRLLALLGG